MVAQVMIGLWRIKKLDQTLTVIPTDPILRPLPRQGRSSHCVDDVPFQVFDSVGLVFKQLTLKRLLTEEV
jgi:hypothetical protein